MECSRRKKLVMSRKEKLMENLKEIAAVLIILGFAYVWMHL